MAPMLDVLTDGVWTASRPLRFFGLEVGARMTVVRLASGGLFVHSPVPLEPALREAVDALGPVEAIVAPNLFHHLHAGAWASAYPKASISACPGLEKKRADVSWSRVLDDTPADEWKQDLDQVFFGAFPMGNEVVFFHRKTKTMISSDVVFNLAKHPSAFTRMVGFFIASKDPGPTLLERLMIKDREAAREQIGRMVAWQAERLVLAHGDVVTANGSAALEKGYAWL